MAIPIAEFYNDQVQLNDINVKVNDSKLKNFKPVHEYYSSDGIFYSDARVCYFNLPFEKKGVRGEVTIQKTALDPRYFTAIYFTEPFFLKKKQVQVIVPHWMKVELKEFNFHGYAIAKQSKTEGDMDIHTYTIENAKALVPFPRSLQYDIRFVIPQGYAAQGLETLNKRVENAAGSFICEATANGQTVTLKVKKSYSAGA